MFSSRSINSPNMPLHLAVGEDETLKVVRVTGKNPAISDAAGMETVWGYNANPADIATAAQVGVKSSSANDSAVWADKVTIYGLDAEGNLQNEELSLNGTTLVTSANTYSFIYGQEVTDWNTVKENAGTIDVKDTGDTSFYSRMESGVNKTHDAIYQIPKGFTGYILDAWGGTGRNQPSGEADFVIAARKQSAVIDTDPGFVDIFPFTTNSSAGMNFFKLTVPIRVEEHWRLRLEANAGDTTTIVYGGFTLLLAKN